MDDKEERLVDLSTQTEVSKWLVVLLIIEFGFALPKQQFWDSVRLRYGCEIASLPTTFPCGNKLIFSIV